MADVLACTQQSNYYVRKMHISGIKTNPYDWTLGGIRYANGRTYVGDGDAPQPAPYQAAVNTPNCRTCHAGCS